MKKTHILSGEELVARGATKHEVSLPELGVKSVLPNGSWLEQKQVQAALEARRHLVQVHRIEKLGALSHAEWNADLGLAEVTQQVGGYWLHMGHHEDKKLYLWPEEALFLMETNCLLLKYNEIPVSLQQAYSLLLKGKYSILQYKVYASLSRLGYKILRHDLVKKADIKEQPNDEDCTSNSKLIDDKDTEDNCVNEELRNEDQVEVTKADSQVADNLVSEVVEINTEMDTSKESKPDEEVIEPQVDNEEPEASSSNSEVISVSNKCSKESRPRIALSRKQIMLQQLMNRASYKNPDTQELDRLFENIPDMYQKTCVTVPVPNEQHLPRNVFLNNTTYTLNLEKIRNRTTSVSPTDVRPYSASDEVNEDSMRRIWGPNATPQDNIWAAPNYQTVPNIQNGFNQQFWSFTPQRPRYQILFGYMVQRPFMPPLQFNMPRFYNGRFQRNQPYFGRPHSHQYRGFYNQQHAGHPHNGLGNNTRLTRKRFRESAGGGPNLYAIRVLAAKLKLLVSNNNNNQEENIQSLQRIVLTYNRTYNTNIRLNNNLDIVDEQENIVETITLEDDDEPKSKRVSKESKSYEENMNRMKKLAQTLRQLDKTGKGTSKHRRAFSNMLKSFNKTYDADVYMENYEVIDRKLILLDTSEEDCFVEENAKPKKKGKKLRNPFSILNLTLNQPSTSNATDDKRKELAKIFRDWLPKDEDFGTAEVLPKDRAFPYDSNEEYFLDFITNYKNDCDSWNHIKMSFWEGVEEAPVKQESNDSDASKNSLVKPEDCKDMASVFEKLRIVQCCTEERSETDLTIDFDVYSRDVPNFRKSDRPTPHFRIVCLDESAAVPSGADVRAVLSSIADCAPVVFAIVGLGSVCYVQMSPTDLPLRVPGQEDS